MTDFNSIYKFDAFVLNPVQRELKAAGAVVDIEPRVFDLLIFLVANRDRAVSKDELQEVIWPGMIVTETALTRAVMKARKAIGDDAVRQAMIKTLHGHGYRFVAPVHSEAITAPPVAAVANPTPQSEATATAKPAAAAVNWRIAAILSVTLVIAAGLAWVLLRPQPATGEEMRIAILPLQDNTGSQDLAWTRLGLMGYANEPVGNDGSMQVVPAGSIIGLAENFGWNGRLDDPENRQMLDKLKQVYAATHVLAMTLEAEKGALRIYYSLLVPDGGLKGGTIVGDSATDLAQGVVQAVYGSVLRRSHLGGAVPLVSRDAFNNEAFARGMDLSLQGRCSEATQFFRVIVEQEPGLFEPRYELAACLRILGQQEDAEALLNSLLGEQRALGASEHLAETLMTLGVLYDRTGRPDEAEAVYDEALKVSKQTGAHALSARILQNQSILFKNRSELDEAARLLDLAMLEYQDAGLEILPGHFYSGRANLAMARGELVEADLELQNALNAYREIGDRRGEAMMLNNTGYLRRMQGKLEEAEAYHLRSLEIREAIGDRVGVGRIHGMLSVVYSSLGRYEEAKQSASSAMAIARESRDRLFEATSLAQLADAELALGEYDAARAHYLDGRNIFVEIQDHLRVLQSDLKIARLDLDTGQQEQAGQLAREVHAASRDQGLMQPEVEALELLGDLGMARGDVAAAIAEYTRGIDRLRETTWASKESELTVKLADAYMDLPDLEASAPLIGALAGGTVDVASLMARARFSFLRGDAGKAAELMTRAKSLAGSSWTGEHEALLTQYAAGQRP